MCDVRGALEAMAPQGETQITPCGESRIGKFEIVSINGPYGSAAKFTVR